MTSTGESPALQIQGLTKWFGTGPDRKVVFQDIDLSVPAGMLVSVVGASGAGKSTFINCIAGLVDSNAGTIKVFGKDIHDAKLRIGMVFQDYSRSLLPWLKVGRNVELPLLDKKIPKEERQERVHQALTAVGLADQAHKHPWQLSGGMQQRVAIARALAYRPGILLMDEPFGALDAQTRADLQDITLKLKQELNITMVFITHDIDEAVYLGDRVMVLAGSPAGIVDDMTVDLPGPRDQLSTKSHESFNKLRERIFGNIKGKPRPAQS